MEQTSNNAEQALGEKGATIDTDNDNNDDDTVVSSSNQDIKSDSSAITDVQSDLRELAWDEDPFLESMEAVIEACGIDDPNFSIDNSSSAPRPPRVSESSSSTVPHPEIYARGFDSLGLDVLTSFSLGALIGGDKYEVAPHETYLENVTIAPPTPWAQMSAYQYATQEIRLFYGEPSRNPTLEKLRDAMVTREKNHDAKMQEREQWLDELENQVEELFGVDSRTEGEDPGILEGVDEGLFELGA